MGGCNTGRAGNRRTSRAVSSSTSRWAEGRPAAVPARRAGRPAAIPARLAAGRPAPTGQQQYQQGGPPPNQPWGQPQYRQGQRYDWGTYQPGHQPPQWSQYNHNFDPRPFQWNQYADHSYRGQPYQPPRGWYERRWAYGQILPAPFWARNYWLVNYWGFGLVDPPYGYVWVRYGNDALMVNIITGQILGSVYWLFY